MAYDSNQSAYYFGDQYQENQQWNNQPPPYEQLQQSSQQSNQFPQQPTQYFNPGVNMQFQQYSYSNTQNFRPPLDTSGGYTGHIFNPASNNPPSGSIPNAAGGNFDDEPPLLEELGINFNHITQKTFIVLNPVKQAQLEVVQDTDLAGPLVFCLILGATLLLSGKLHFGYIYGIGLTGCVSMYLLLNMMSMNAASVTCIMSTLGYCLLPMCLLSGLAILISLKGLLGIIVTSIAVLWCSISASKLFVTGLGMDHQQFLVAYPCALLYGVFALLAVF